METFRLRRFIENLSKYSFTQELLWIVRRDIKMCYLIHISNKQHAASYKRETILLKENTIDQRLSTWGTRTPRDT